MTTIYNTQQQIDDALDLLKKGETILVDTPGGRVQVVPKDFWKNTYLAGKLPLSVFDMIPLGRKRRVHGLHAFGEEDVRQWLSRSEVILK